MKNSLIEKISWHLLKHGYTVKTIAGGFDVIARNKGRILVLKVLEDANSISEHDIEAMKKVSNYVNGTPLLIAEKAGRKLQDNVVYSRSGIFTINFETLKNGIMKRLPFVKADKAGFTAEVKGNELKRIREDEGLSLSNLSRKIGVSARMLARYEEGSSNVTLQKAMRIYDMFGPQVFRSVNIFSFSSGMAERGNDILSGKYNELGFDANKISKVPFDIIARRENELILTKVGDNVDRNLDEMARMIDADDLVIFKKKKPSNIAALTKEEFLDFEDAEELIKFLREFRE